MTDKDTRRRGRPRSFHDKVDDKIVQSLDKALLVLKAVAVGGGQSLSELATATAVSAPTVYRSLITMQQHGIVTFDEQFQLWRVDVEAFRIGTAFLENTNVAEEARPLMQALMNRTGETANLGIISGQEVVFLSQVETHEPIRAFFRPGTRSAIHSSGIGKALFSFLPEDRARAMAESLQLIAYTSNTIVTASDLIAMRKEVLNRGFAIDDEERTDGMRCVAAPIFNSFGEAVTAISVSGPSVRLSSDKLDHLGQMVKEAATTITRNTGGTIPETAS